MNAIVSPEPSSSYDEAEIIGLLTEIYKTLARQGHLADNDVDWPPPKGRDIPLGSLADPSHLDEWVISLMRKLPIGPEVEVLPHMRPVYYMNANELSRSRDIDRRPADFQPLGPGGVESDALPTVLLLFEQWESTDPVLVLDIADNTLRLFDEVYNGPHYMDFPAEHAPTYLRRVLKNCRSATWMTWFNSSIPETVNRLRWAPELRRVFTADYHWPDDDFREADWKRDGPGVVQRLINDIGW